MIINHNITALNTYNQLSNANSSASKSMEKLSSGLRINSASDDAAGLAISEKMRGQIRGLEQASRNAQDGISLIQTAEGALEETQSILQRMRELAVQSANDTNTDDDRAEIQKEIDQLTEEIDRISESTQFNTKGLLNGDSGTKVTENIGDVSGAVSTNDNIQEGMYSVSVTQMATQASLGDEGALGSIGNTGALAVEINGEIISFDSGTTDAEAQANFIAAVNESDLGITASVGVTNGGTVLTADEYGSETITVTGNATALGLGLTTGAGANNTDTGLDIAGSIGGDTTTGTGLTLTSTDGDSIGLQVDISENNTNTSTSLGDIIVDKNDIKTQIGANKDQTMTITINSMSSADLGVNSLDLNSQSGANSAIESIDNAIKSVSGERSKLGSYQNRLDHTINNLGAASENLTAAESRIRDVDMAKEMMSYTKDNILGQAATAMLAQANQLPQGVLQLLG
ncbi:flagellin N-terminal helical domain-containing protein [Chengkuizengella axinellae]|uniref:Flagellin n=1 Tax=Chengkuizengella axinellae TaxID=3064388 RepID=A0ABT9J2P9_9BACL|nr:flagellin [Chengkuizengella sp. 2205SS18-9]MDP5275887.1 flagellin [Chengkuizengella sp. 2205SS18-9]